MRPPFRRRRNMIVIEKLKVRTRHRVQVLSLAREVVVGLTPRGAAWDPGMPSEPTISGIKTQYRQMRDSARALWWENNRGSLSRNYKRWELEYRIVDPPELLLSRPILHRLLPLRSTHGDFHWYHAKLSYNINPLALLAPRSS